MQHAFRGSRRLFAFLSACALVSAAFAAGASAHAVAKNKGHHRHGHHHGNGGVTISKLSPWGMAPDGISADLYTLQNSNGMIVKITNFGGVVQSIWVPDKRGRSRDVVLGFPSLSDYVNDFFQGHTGTPWPAPGGSGNTYFGAIIGRYANRIANASFDLPGPGGGHYTLDANNGPNTLHGGFLGWNTAVWDAATSTGSGTASLELTHTFPGGEGCDPAQTKTPCNGFPADVRATVVYTLTRDNQLKITYTAINSSTKLDTVINLTNHSYFNLAGEASGTVERQLLQINADQYTPVNANLIPEAPYFVNVAGTAFDFRHLTPIGKNIRNTNLPDGFAAPAGQLKQLQIAHGYDHNWVLNGSGYRLVSTALDPGSGIVLRTFTDQPGVQFYSSNFLVGDLIGTSGNTYRQTQAFTLETQHYPDSPHHIGDPAWPSVVLRAGGTFNSTTSYQLGVLGGDHGDRGHKSHKKH
ncbi:MAG TPA: aldose epimerase family protein [Solirubrobacteraceae bacterium]|nr:aldose epimerase family protein [Solirubrobacteraceae bacterium]